MLSHKNRIVKKEDFLRIKKYGRSYFSGNIELRVMETRLEEARIGFVVGMNFSKKAVERNRAKRWAREIFRGQLRELKKAKDILVVIRKNKQEKMQKDKIKEDLRQAIKQAGITM